MMATVSKKQISLAGWTLNVTPTESRLPAPTWNFKQIQIGPGPQDAHFETHQTQTTGSSVVWGDEWRFSKNRRLASLIWSVPDLDGPMPANFGPTAPATLSLDKIDGEVGMPEMRAFDGAQLVCGRREPLKQPTSFQIAPGLTVIIQNQQWWGWRLAQPLRYLPSGPGPAALAPQVDRWFKLINDDTVDIMSDQDAAQKQQLELLQADAEALRHPAADILAQQVASILENFYG